MIWHRINPYFSAKLLDYEFGYCKTKTHASSVDILRFCDLPEKLE